MRKKSLGMGNFPISKKFKKSVTKIPGLWIGKFKTCAKNPCKWEIVQWAGFIGEEFREVAEKQDVAEFAFYEFFRDL